MRDDLLQGRGGDAVVISTQEIRIRQLERQLEQAGALNCQEVKTAQLTAARAKAWADVASAKAQDAEKKLLAAQAQIRDQIEEAARLRSRVAFQEQVLMDTRAALCEIRGDRDCSAVIAVSIQFLIEGVDPAEERAEKDAGILRGLQEDLAGFSQRAPLAGFPNELRLIHTS
jgi:hypothetical protein